jgi:hypothetical protein
VRLIAQVKAVAGPDNVVNDTGLSVLVQKGAYLLMFAPVAKLSLCAVGIGKTPRTNMSFDGREVGLQGSVPYAP